MIKVLDIGAGGESLAEKILNLDESGLEYEIVSLDVNPAADPTILHDITEPLPEEHQDEYDLVLASHVLEHIPRDKIDQTFAHMVSALKNLGEIWVLVPSLEWAAAQILELKHTLAVEAHIFGKQDSEWEFHRTGFTMRMLRLLMESQNLLIKKTFQSQYLIQFEEMSYVCIQNVAIGARYDGFTNPALAID